MVEYLLGINLDGCIFQGGIHFGAVLFDDLWRHMPARLRRFLMLRQRPRGWLIQSANAIQAVGGLAVGTQRGEADTSFTQGQLERAGLHYDALWMLPPGVAVIQHKVRCASRCRVVIDDQQEILDEIESIFGPACPRLYNSTRDQAAIQAWAGV